MFSGGRSFRIVLLGGGGGGLGGGGGGIAALDELFDNVGAPIYKKTLFLSWSSGIMNFCASFIFLSNDNLSRVEVSNLKYLSTDKIKSIN